MCPHSNVQHVCVCSVVCLHWEFALIFECNSPILKSLLHIYVYILILLVLFCTTLKGHQFNAWFDPSYHIHIHVVLDLLPAPLPTTAIYSHACLSPLYFLPFSVSFAGFQGDLCIYIQYVILCVLPCGCYRYM